MQKIVKTSFIYLFTIVVTFLFGIVVSDTINFYNSNYEIVFSVNEEFDYEKLDDQDYLISIKNTPFSVRISTFPSYFSAVFLMLSSPNP